MGTDNSDVPVKGGQVLVLCDRTEESKAAGNAAQAELAIDEQKTDAVVIVSATGSAAYRSGGGVNAGIVLSIFLDNKVVAHDDSFEGTASNLTFRVSASHTFYLRANHPAKIKAKVDHYGSGSAQNEKTEVSLHVIAMAARKP